MARLRLQSSTVPCTDMPSSQANRTRVRYAEQSAPQSIVALHTSSRGRSEFGWSGSTDSYLTVANWLVGHGELSQIVADHVSFDLNWIPVLSTVDINDGSTHFWDNNTVSKMSFHTLWLFTWDGSFLGLSELCAKSVVFSMDSSLESPLLSGSHEFDNLLWVHFEELIKLVASVHLLSEGLPFRYCFWHPYCLLKLDA